MPAVKANVLVWARETAGLSVEAAAAKLGFRGESGSDRLTQIEQGARQPSRAQLVNMAKAYRRSLLTLYLSEPPRRGDRGEDFRTLPERATQAEPFVEALVRDVTMRQSLVRSVLEDEEDSEALGFVGSASLDEGAAHVASSMRVALDFDLEAFRRCSDVNAAFSYVRGKVEDAGIFVLLVGNLGSHHTNIGVTQFRGFALADNVAPFVVINENDARSAWAFTLLHEVAHLWLGITGISGARAESRVERLCNDVASALLLPRADLESLEASIEGLTEDELVAVISDFARPRFISRTLVAYRLFLRRRVSDASWNQLSTRFRTEWLARREADRQERRAGLSGGPNYYVVRRHRLGRGLLSVVERSVQEGTLTPTKAGLVLGVKPRNVAPLLSSGSRAAS